MQNSLINCSDSHMRRCFELAMGGDGLVSPNPLVGALLVKNGKIIGEGFHVESGQHHAEVNTINRVKGSIEGSTLYCNLEPCCHTNKRTPPCTDLIISRGISRVVISNLDPNPLVSGRGVERLRQAGIEVSVGLLEEKGHLLNEVFFKYITTKRPFVHLKVAQTIDGRIATSSGHSKWITNQSSRARVHQLRAKYDAICVGRETLNLDNPQLTVRLDPPYRGKAPYRVILGNPNKMNLDSRVFNDSLADRTIVACSDVELSKLNLTARNLLESRNVKFIEIDETRKGKIDWAKLIARLGECMITSLFIEGGSGIYSDLISNRLVDRLSIFIAPKVFGSGKNWLQYTDIDRVEDSIGFMIEDVKTFDQQILVEMLPLNKE